MLGNFSCFCCQFADHFFQFKFKIKNSSRNTISVKLFGSRSGPEVIKLFSSSTQLSTKFILLINVKKPTTVGILTFISMINTTSERLIARNFICQYFSFLSSWNLELSWAEHEKSFITSGPGLMFFIQSDWYNNVWRFHYTYRAP